MQTAKLVVTPLTEQKSANLDDESTACDQIQHALYTAFVGHKCIAGRPDLLFVTKTPSYKLASPTLAHLTRAKKALLEENATHESPPDDHIIDTQRREPGTETHYWIL